MPINKNAWIRYQALDRCFSNRVKRYYIGDLVAACSAAMVEHGSGKASISRRQVLEDIKFMESEQGWAIPLERIKDSTQVYFRYRQRNFTIANRPLNKEESKQLEQVLKFLSRFHGLPQFNWLVEAAARLQGDMGLKAGTAQAMAFQENRELEGAVHIAPMLDAIMARKVLRVTYRSFRQEQGESFLFHPHLLKQYNNRWFLLGCREGREEVTNLALDRVIQLEEAPDTPYRASDTDWDEHFDDVVGVTVPDSRVERVRIRVGASTWPYVRTKPLHHSQRVKGNDDAAVEIEVRLKVNHELIARLLEHGPGVEVLEPESLREKMKEHIQQMASHYGLVEAVTQPSAKP
ncbi:MAG: WYL domain-containing protein [Flavobacteriales bacterium]|nr:WYL domain-containing protein [Flavobacteriales bacterium]